MKLIVSLIVLTLSMAAVASEVKTIFLREQNATCFQGPSTALARVLLLVNDQAVEACQNMGAITVLQDVTSKLEVEIIPKDGPVCGGVRAKLQIDCLIIE